MLLFPLALVTGVVIGLASGGRIGALAELRLRGPWLVFAAAGAQIADGALPAASRAGAAGQVLLVASYLAVGAFLAWNLRGRRGVLAAGLWLAGAGWLANMVVVGANGGMPVSAAALRRLHLPPPALAGGGEFGKHLLAGHTLLAFLGDNLTLPAPRAAISVGDIAMMAGIVVAVAGAMTVSRRDSARRGQAGASADRATADEAA